MALTSTQPLPVAKVIYTSSSSGKLTFVMGTSPAPLHIVGIVITRTTGHFTGTITPSTGKVLLYVDATTFSDLRAQAVLPFSVVLSYDDVTLEPVQLDLIRDVVSLAALLRDTPPEEALVEAPKHRPYGAAE